MNKLSSSQSCKRSTKRISCSILSVVLLSCLIAATSPIGVHAAKGVETQPILSEINIRIQRFIMRFVRDIGRYKTQKRRNTSTSLSVFLMGKDKLLEEEALDDLLNSAELVSIEELHDATGQISETDDHSKSPIYLSVLGHVFDVSAGEKFYGQGNKYHMLAGQDATLPLSTGDMRKLNVKSKITEIPQYSMEEDLSERDLAEANRWLEYFALHDKYIHVGRMARESDGVVDLDALVDDALLIKDQILSDDDGIDSDDYASTRGNDTTSINDDNNVREEKKSQLPKWHPKFSGNMADSNDMSCPGGSSDGGVGIQYKSSSSSSNSNSEEKAEEELIPQNLNDQMQ
eukprot:CAMPEP_0194373286 /NCGR_PEP_ID=MMETSP0174-20130528/21717_1 /TAXON_ID=216777 /ORGANISM="Proboscia alata, Strain PI-D3" /LENGTH=344 /DNA_ID=CAMNT_0039152267 /DNA_START=141 /DNA_END=1176 /DNA_ORIENTATION=+